MWIYMNLRSNYHVELLWNYRSLLTVCSRLCSRGSCSCPFCLGIMCICCCCRCCLLDDSMVLCIKIRSNGCHSITLVAVSIQHSLKLPHCHQPLSEKRDPLLQLTHLTSIMTTLSVCRHSVGMTEFSEMLWILHLQSSASNHLFFYSWKLLIVFYSIIFGGDLCGQWVTICLYVLLFLLHSLWHSVIFL